MCVCVHVCARVCVCPPSVQELPKGRQRVFHGAVAAKSCLTRCDPIDGSPSGSPVPGNLQARTLAWVAVSLSNA